MIEEISNPYTVGVPLSHFQSSFVGRAEIVLRIQAWSRSAVYSPLLIYGPRRMGKTSLLRNLQRLLPRQVAFVVIDLQGVSALATDFAGFLTALASEITRSILFTRNIMLPRLSLKSTLDNPQESFDQWMTVLVSTLLLHGIDTLVLALDEFEALDIAIQDKQLGEENVLGTLRQLIEHHPQIKLLLAGAHALEEIQGWSNYLRNAQTLHLSYLTTGEARLLIERPMKDSALKYEPAAVARVLHLTHGHPYLVQLVCSELMHLKNEQTTKLRHHITENDIQLALPDILLRGSQFFAEIEENQVNPEGCHLLYWIARRGYCRLADLQTLAKRHGQCLQVEEALTQMIQRGTLELRAGYYHFQVELVRMWFAGNESVGQCTNPLSY
ncbi:MAG: AAA-like domain-containing protein [Caldilineaceae bacterium]